jgi:hypothetical protein
MNTTIRMITAHGLAPGRTKCASAKGMRFTAEWQAGMETITGFPQRKLRLFFAPSELHGNATQANPAKDRWHKFTFPLDF